MFIKKLLLLYLVVDMTKDMFNCKCERGRERRELTEQHAVLVCEQPAGDERHPVHLRLGRRPPHRLDLDHPLSVQQRTVLLLDAAGKQQQQHNNNNRNNNNRNQHDGDDDAEVKQQQQQ